MHIRSAVRWLPWLMLPLAAAAADEGRISFLEQEVRNLQRQVQALTRQMDEMRTRPDRPARAAASPGTNLDEPEADLPRWVDAQRWRQVRRGMSELEVISSLGAPNSVRDEGDARVLFYAMEIGTARFLAGSVKIREQAVVEVIAPTLQ